MKAYEDLVPIMVCGGKARDFFGEYMAGGILVLLGMNTQFPEQDLVGGFCGTGMHGGAIFLRGEVQPWQVGKECGIFEADEDDMKRLTAIIKDYAEALDLDADEILSGTFTKLVPVSHRPYGKLYAP
jgi:glutamate synthase domain-containing protein 3